MKKEQAEALKLQIVERRNYFKQFDSPLLYSKTQLHGGMQGRVARQEDRRFVRDIRKRDVALKRNISNIDKYIRDLKAYNNRPQQPIGEGVPEIKAPVAPNIKLRPMPKMSRPIRNIPGGWR